MSSGPLEFFELNITCSANTECYTHGLNLECRRTGYCGAAPEEKPAEAYIKLTNASLRDQNPDDDEEEDEYYKWKAAKANQVAPEP